MAQELWLVRHGETEWSRTGQHTGRTDKPLTDVGRQKASELGQRLAGRKFAIVLSSPLGRALDTCRLAGYGDVVQIEQNLREYDYGDYEGRTTLDIRKERPEWSLWTTTPPNGETLDQAATRAQTVIDRAMQSGGDAALFAHGHILRILTACWLGLPPAGGRMFALSTASLSVLGYERATRVINRWNEAS